MPLQHSEWNQSTKNEPKQFSVIPVLLLFVIPVPFRRIIFDTLLLLQPETILPLPLWTSRLILDTKNVLFSKFRNSNFKKFKTELIKNAN